MNLKLYPKNWKTFYIPKLKERSGNRCELCRLANYSIVLSYQVKFRRLNKIIYRREWTEILKPGDKKKWKFVTVVLSAIHLDHDRYNSNVSLERLRYACQRCHLNFDSHTKAQKRKDKKK